MRKAGWLSLVVVGLTLSGCTSGFKESGLSRVESQIGLLDARVTELERVKAEDLSVTPVFESVQSSPVIVGAGDSSLSGWVSPSRHDIQRALTGAGFYTGPIDGKIGRRSRTSIKAFQRVHGLVDDGKVGPKTWAQLQLYLNSTLQEESDVLTEDTEFVK